MVKRQQDKRTTESREIGGHKITYRKVGELEEIEIDGELVRFFRVGKRYQLERAAYEDPYDSLLDAAEAFAKTLPSRKR